MHKFPTPVQNDIRTNRFIFLIQHAHNCINRLLDILEEFLFLFFPGNLRVLFFDNNYAQNSRYRILF